MQSALDDMRVVRAAHATEITAVAFAQPMALLVTGDRHGTVRAWDFQDLKPVRFAWRACSACSTYTCTHDAVQMMEISLGDVSITAAMCMREHAVFFAACSDGTLHAFTGRGHAHPFQKVYVWHSLFETTQLHVSRSSKSPSLWHPRKSTRCTLSCLNRAAYLPKNAPNAHRRWSMLRSSVRKQDDSTADERPSAPQRVQLAAFVERMLLKKGAASLQGSWRQFRCA